MASVFICAQGHTWQLPDDEAPETGEAQTACPVCGAAPRAPVSEAARSNEASESEARAATVLQAAPGIAQEDTRPPGPDSAVVPREPQPNSAGPASKQAAADFKTLPHLPGYELIEELGRGGMGMVLKARQTKLDRLVAVKILPPDTGADVAFAERFGREARALARLSHPHIVTVHDFGQVEGLSYIVMEFVAGMNLRQRLREGRVPLDQVRAIMAQLCDALQYAHEEGIVHRDIKPENILFDRQGRVRIADFGLAKLTARTTADFTLTAAGQVMGTWNYMAPEQFDNPLAVDRRADIYALGVVLYEMLTGEVPRARFPLPSEKAGVAPGFDQVVLRALERDPGQRYQSIGEFRAALESVGAPAPRAVIDVIPPPVIPGEAADPPQPKPIAPVSESMIGWGTLIVAALCLVVWPLAMVLAIPVLIWLCYTLRQPDGKARFKRQIAKFERLIRSVLRHTIGSTTAWAACASIIGIAASLQPFFPVAELVAQGAYPVEPLDVVYPYNQVFGIVPAIAFATVLLFLIAFPSNGVGRLVRAGLLFSAGTIVLVLTVGLMYQSQVSANISQGTQDTTINGYCRILDRQLPFTLIYLPSVQILEVQAGTGHARFQVPSTAGSVSAELLLNRVRISFPPLAFVSPVLGAFLILLAGVNVRTMFRLKQQQHPMRLTTHLALLAALLASSLHADEKLAGIACRSVHLGYPAPEGIAFYTELTVEQSAEGTYFMAAGWSKGYFGIQALADRKKLVLFSVWDPTAGDDPKKVDETQRVKLLHQDDAVRVQRFGGEGTGGQSFFDFEWKVGETYRFLVTAKAEDAARTAYAGYFFLPATKEWKHLVTFSTITNGTLLKGCYSFVEDFRRNRVSATQERRATFGNGWIKPAKGDWVPLDKARFTADANPVLNIDAGARGDRFFLATGGNVQNDTTKLGETIRRETEKSPARPPKDLPKFE